jgi:hypothetical protein
MNAIEMNIDWMDMSLSGIALSCGIKFVMPHYNSFIADKAPIFSPIFSTVFLLQVSLQLATT